MELRCEARLKRDEYEVDSNVKRTTLCASTVSGFLAACGEWLRSLDWSDSPPLARNFSRTCSPAVELRMQQIPGHFGNSFECMSRLEMAAYAITTMPDLRNQLNPIRYGTYVHAGYSGKANDKYGRNGTHCAPRRLQQLIRQERYDHLQRKVWGTGVRRHILQDAHYVPAWLNQYWQTRYADRRPLLRRESGGKAPQMDLNRM